MIDDPVTSSDDTGSILLCSSDTFLDSIGEPVKMLVLFAQGCR